MSTVSCVILLFRRVSRRRSFVPFQLEFTHCPLRPPDIPWHSLPILEIPNFGNYFKLTVLSQWQYYLKLEPFAIIFSIDIIVSVNKSKQISLLN